MQAEVFICLAFWKFLKIYGPSIMSRQSAFPLTKTTLGYFCSRSNNSSMRDILSLRSDQCCVSLTCAEEASHS